LEDITEPDQSDGDPHIIDEECSGETQERSEDSHQDQLFVGEISQPEIFEKYPLIDNHDDAKKSQDISAEFSRQSKFLMQEKRKRSLIDHDSERDDREGQIIFSFFGDKHIHENAFEIYAYFFDLSDDFSGFGHSSEDEEHIDQTDPCTDKKWCSDSPLQKPRTQGRTYDKTKSENHAEERKIIGAFFRIFRNICEDGGDSAHISSGDSIDDSSYDIDEDGIPKSYDQR